MHHPIADTGMLHLKRKGGRRDVLHIEATYKAEGIHTAENMNTKCAEDHFVNIVKNHRCNKPNMNLTIQTMAKVAED